MTSTALHRRDPRPSVVRQVIGTSRPLSWVNTAYPFGAAYLLAGGGLDVVFWLGTLYFLVPYNLLMYGVNDVFDYESDLRNPRKGGVEGVVLDRHVHRLTLILSAVTNLPFLYALAVLGDAASTAVLAGVVFAVVAYSAPVLRFKERPVLDSLTSSTHFVGPATFGLAIAGPWPSGAWMILAAFFAWGIASHAFGAVQDIRADRDAGIASVATALGARPTVWLALAAYLACAVLLLAAGSMAAIAAVLVVPYLLNVAPYARIRDDECERAHHGWRRFLWLNYLTGFFVTQLLIWATIGW
ncbi:prenyltransferase [Aeromicrobium phragmitis]|uniref:Prenyltransferase n=1 Tax=Aeromicrobium phragmitis TaxID=2478914 RepID=A0A3L8PS49_9ACTN|nr:prenyltransferase [Aeromicrobium phragmitis]RLV56792.1 prenyltransferase [Aeromicrobium phragmitis]